MQAIAEEIVQKYVPQIAAEIYNEALQRLVGALQYDVETIVTVSLEDVGQVFKSSQYRKIISDRIMKELTSRLDGLKFNI